MSSISSKPYISITPTSTQPMYNMQVFYSEETVPLLFSKLIPAKVKTKFDNPVAY